ncbi:IRK-interacting protein [Bienertia sinuspersici]
MPIPGQTISDSWEERLNLDDDNNNHVCPADDCKSMASSCTNKLTFLQNSPGTEVFKSRRRNSLGDLKSVSSCNNCKPATISTTATDNKSKSQGMILSWLFKRRQKNENSSPLRTESEVSSQVLKDLGSVSSIEVLKKELIETHQKKEAALAEVSEMRFSFGELRKKLENLESYCEELKKALRQAVQTKSHSKREKMGDTLMPVSEDVMVEGFLQIVSEARLSVKQFCKTLIEQIDDSDEQLTGNLNMLLKPYKLSLNSRYSQAVFKGPYKLLGYFPMLCYFPIKITKSYPIFLIIFM